MTSKYGNCLDCGENVTRRTFMKTTAGVAGAAALGGWAPPRDDEPETLVA